MSPSNRGYFFLSFAEGILLSFFEKRAKGGQPSYAQVGMLLKNNLPYEIMDVGVLCMGGRTSYVRTPTHTSHLRSKCSYTHSPYRAVLSTPIPTEWAKYGDPHTCIRMGVRTSHPILRIARRAIRILRTATVGGVLEVYTLQIA